MMHLCPTLLLLPTLLASPIPDDGLSRITKPDFGFDSIRLLGQTSCVVPPEGVAFVDGWVNGYFVRVLGVSKWGIQGPGGKTVASNCEDVAFGMLEFMEEQSGCLVPFEGYFINGGAWTARGNGDLWVST